jgi:FkbH-like protein
MAKPRIIKCVVWDLDNTVWQGTLLEGDPCALRPGVVELIRTLDERGILQSVVSRNDRETALAHLASLGIAEYFLCPQIGWDAKSAALGRIAERLNIGIDTLAFIDDEPFERAEVASARPEVLVLDAAEIAGLAARPELTPPNVTAESRSRRQMYLAEERRTEAEQSFSGPSETFLAGLAMKLSIAPAGEADLARCEELTVRTNQLNTTGRPYSRDELLFLSRSAGHKLLVAELDDRFGSYGKIGLVLLECTAEAWTIKLLLMSCRVMSRGIGTILINYLCDEARRAEVRLRAEYIPNQKNRLMLVTFRFNGFREVDRDGPVLVFENELSTIRRAPDYVSLIAA